MLVCGGAQCILEDATLRETLTSQLQALRGRGLFVLATFLDRCPHDHTLYTFLTQPEVLRCLRDTRDVCVSIALCRYRLVLGIVCMATVMRLPVEALFTNEGDPEERLAARHRRGPSGSHVSYECAIPRKRRPPPQSWNPFPP